MEKEFKDFFLHYAKTAFIFFFISGLLGAILRLTFFQPIPGLNYKFTLHGHSHVIFLGWIFNVLFLGFNYVLNQNHPISNWKKYNIVFWLLQLTVVGMLIFFPIQGYALWSIIFSTANIFISYSYVFFYFRDVRKMTILKDSLSIGLIKWALIFLAISTIGPFSLGPVIAMGYAESDWYYLAIYFYLHFQYNGLFTFGVLGLLFGILEKNGIIYDRKKARRFLTLMIISCFLSLALSALWTHPPDYIYIIGVISVIIQLIAFYDGISLYRSFRQQLFTLAKGKVVWLIKLSLLAFVIKILLQSLSAIPEVADMAFQNRNFIIAYLHLIFLGFISFFLIAWLIHHHFINQYSRAVGLGLILLVTGFTISELLIGFQPYLFKLFPAVASYYYPMLFWCSLLMPVGILFLLVNNRHRPGSEKEVHFI
ncbi:hypothetical protein [Splendidivirga corallicola]|uniref:hypothetical protein n=1 Tax=Splendidivirga corallicola TaxID=3051826 RepID=UPI003211A9C9